ncbi:hypothetical protein M885DRAFT_514699 [Pelagophyceae sp. CCMP2097]|nr:hypothetical protein M885DRAFT_514699 [Pelagophyceae sp. CCMP2097]
MVRSDGKLRRRSGKSPRAWSASKGGKVIDLSGRGSSISLSDIGTSPSQCGRSPVRIRLRKGKHLKPKPAGPPKREVIELDDDDDDDDDAGEPAPKRRLRAGPSARRGLHAAPSARRGPQAAKASRLDDVRLLDDEADVVGSDSGDESSEDDDESVEGLIDDSALSQASDGALHRSLFQSLDDKSPKICALGRGRHRLRRGGVLRAALRHRGDAANFEDNFQAGGEGASQESAVSGATNDSRYVDTDDEGYDGVNCREFNGEEEEEEEETPRTEQPKTKQPRAGEAARWLPRNQQPTKRRRDSYEEYGDDVAAETAQWPSRRQPQKELRDSIDETSAAPRPRAFWKADPPAPPRAAPAPQPFSIQAALRPNFAPPRPALPPCPAPPPRPVLRETQAGAVLPGKADSSNKTLLSSAQRQKIEANRLAALARKAGKGAAAAAPASLTDAQRARIEASKLVALERKRQREAAQVIVID